MADLKISQLTAISVLTPATDVLPVVDVGGVTKKITTNQILASGGVASLASATITGDLTVDTNVLKVDTTNNRVGIGTASPAATFSALIGSEFLHFGFGANNDNYYTVGASGTHLWRNSGTEQMRLNSSGNLGIGVSPTSYGGTYRTLAVNATDAGILDLMSNSVSQFRIFGNGVENRLGGITNVPLTFHTNNSEKMQISASGNVGIGVTPSAWDSANYKALQVSRTSVASLSNIGIFAANWFADTGGDKYIATATAARIDVNNAGGIQFKLAPSGTAGNAITFTQAMTLDTSGRLLVGQTSTGLLNLNGIDIEGGDSNGGSYIIINHKLATVAGQQYAFFAYNGVKTGDITQNGTTGVLYNTVSDYRLKESVKPISNGLARVNSLKPSSYNWKSDGSVGEGFIAHELAEVVPAAVSGEKDALNADESIKAQSVDMSRIIPILVAAIQELTAEVNALKNA